MSFPVPPSLSILPEMPSLKGACSAPDVSVFALMVAYDAKTKPLPNLSTCPRAIEKPQLDIFNMPGPFPEIATVGSNVVNSKFGPIDDADRMLIQAVRRAGLWEEPAGRRAALDGSCERVKEIGKIISEEHAFLDKVLKGIADELSIPIPDNLSTQQQQFMHELACASPTQWDVTFAMRLRQAHGNVFTLISEVRTKTRNSLMRYFATVANNVVLKHMVLLESTGLVEYGILPVSEVLKAGDDRKNLGGSFV
ncbi:hypothetical protein HDU97_008462 [Phlyctochytrium planicorne]|nr:hypothetical protein HDU97_008462 [Phlyctochytrium planicorne]